MEFFFQILCQIIKLQDKEEGGLIFHVFQITHESNDGLTGKNL